MASYDLKCGGCGREFEVFVQGFLKDDHRVCPDCGSTQVEQRFTGFMMGSTGDAYVTMMEDFPDALRNLYGMNNGTAEQEQNGVTTPNPAASTLPTPCRLPPSSARVCSVLKKERMRVTRKIIPASSIRILGTSYKKKLTDSARWVPGAKPMRL